MARPQVADGGDGLQVWRAAVNILNKLSRTADRGWSSSMVVERGVTHSTVKSQYVTKCCTGPRTLTDSSERPKQRKLDLIFVTWNGMSGVCRSDSLKTISRQLVKKEKVRFSGSTGS
jgi:hypothetical protein